MNWTLNANLDEVSMHGSEVAFAQVLDQLLLLIRHVLSPVTEKVLVECVFGGVVVLERSSKSLVKDEIVESSHFRYREDSSLLHSFPILYLFLSSAFSSPPTSSRKSQQSPRRQGWVWSSPRRTWKRRGLEGARIREGTWRPYVPRTSICFHRWASPLPTISTRVPLALRGTEENAKLSRMGLFYKLCTTIVCRWRFFT